MNINVLFVENSDMVLISVGAEHRGVLDDCERNDRFHCFSGRQNGDRDCSGNHHRDYRGGGSTNQHHHHEDQKEKK